MAVRYHAAGEHWRAAVVVAGSPHASERSSLLVLTSCAAATA
jgi:hypothetical protein